MRAKYLVFLCLFTAGANAGSRTQGEPTAPPVGVGARPCALANPISKVLRRTSLENEWKALEQELESPLRSALGEDLVTQEALASLDTRVLAGNDWSLTRYFVRLLRELEAPDLPSADGLLRLDAYAEHALRDAAWDGKNAWDVVSAVRAETLELLATLEIQRRAGPSAVLVDRLLQAAGKPESYSLASDCRQPRDFAPTLVNVRPQP